jgi:carboxymethylenebutenolidase
MSLDGHKLYLLEEFAEDYHARQMSRRDLLRRTLIVTGSIPLAASMLTALGCGDSDDEAEPPAAAAQPTTPPLATTAAGVGPGVSPTDPAIEVKDLQIPGPASQLFGYLARPKANGTFPGVVIIHENQGMLEHFKDVARRFAKEGFVGLAVDLASRDGGSKPDPTQNSGYTRLPSTDLVADLMAYTSYIKTQPFVKANALGVTGFCFGGGFAFELATASPDFKAAVPYYGTAMPVMEKLKTTKTAFLVMYGETDTRLTAQGTDVEAALKQSGTPYQIKIYPGAGHAFFGDHKTSYHEASAKDAWTQTLAWFRKYLTG